MGLENSKLYNIQCTLREFEQKLNALEQENSKLREEIERRRKLREDYPCPIFLEKTKDYINVAITGKSGSGKSTLINQLRGIKPGQEGEAKTGPNECTAEPQCYSIPKSHKAEHWILYLFRLFGFIPLIRADPDFDKQIYYWDLPGAGTEKFPSETYIQQMGLRWFHAAIVVGDTRYTEVDAKLIKELDKHAVSYLYVRSKMDDQANSQKLNGIPPKETFEQVRKYLKENVGINRPYLIGLRYIQRYRRGAWENRDWVQLQEKLYYEVAVSAQAWEKIKKLFN